MRTLSNLAKFFIICAAVFFVGLVCTIIGVAAGGFEGINKIAEKYDWIQGDPGERTVISQTVEDFQSVAVTGYADYWIVGRDFYKSEKWLADQDLLTEKEAALIEPNQVSIICGENADKPEIKVEKGVLTIDAGAKDVSGISFSTSDAPWNPEVLICVPDEVLESLTASSEIGDINCLGVAWKNARIELNSGTVNRGGVRSGGLVAEEFHDIAAFDQTHALGGETLQLDRADLGAVLVALAALLRLLVVVEFAFDPLVGAVEEIDGRPQEVLKVGFEASFA